MPTPPLSDELAFAAVEAVRQHGSVTAAALALGMPRGTLQNRLQAAARLGSAPGHFENGVAPGYLMGKVTVQRNAGGGIERTWERQSPDAEATREMMEAAAAAMAEALPRAKPSKAPAKANGDLLNVYPVFDAHVGALCWHREGGADWDLKIAEETLTSAVAAMVEGAPIAEHAVIIQGGDFLHTDGLKALTPASGHLLDADGRFGKIVEVAIRTLRRMVALALTKHTTVTLVIASGNHDEASSIWLRKMFAALYEDEPRLSVDDSELPYYAHSFGAVMLGVHHGHLKRNDDLPLFFAAQFPSMWGGTQYRYAHVGHRHHAEEKEHSGMIVTQHPTIAARDAYAARGGWHAQRNISAITYHRRFGKVATYTVNPSMLEAA